ncbi:MAG: hypothetical protein LBR79_02200 [Oscillospiraceae bacterium]|jgi:hypothetical protein|nr:hypothetical protein [Oscillospiraceae bacterium]
MAPTTKYKQIILNYTAAVQNLNESVELRDCTLEDFLKPLNKAVKEAKGIEKETHSKINWKKVRQQYESYVEKGLAKQCPELERDFSDYSDMNRIVNCIRSCTQLNEKDDRECIKPLVEELNGTFTCHPEMLKLLNVYGKFKKLKSDVEYLNRELIGYYIPEEKNRHVKDIKSAAESIIETCKDKMSEFQEKVNNRFNGSSKTKERAKIVKNSSTLTLIQVAKKKKSKASTIAVLNQLKKNHKIMLGAAVDKTLKVLETKKF